MGHMLNLVLQEFNPEKYRQLVGIFSQAYLTTGSPVSIVNFFLSVYTRGEIADPPALYEPFSENSFDNRRAYIAKPLRGEYGECLLFVHCCVGACPTIINFTRCCTDIWH